MRMAASARCRASCVLTRTLSTTNSASCSTNSLRIRARCRVKNLRRSASVESWASAAIAFRGEAVLRVPGIGKTQVLELPAKPLDASLAGESNRAYGEPQLLGNFRVGPRGDFIKEQLHQSTALRREGGHGFAQDLLFLCLLDQVFGDGRDFRFRQ